MDARRPFARGLQGQATVSQKTGRRPEMSGLKRSRDKFRRFGVPENLSCAYLLVLLGLAFCA